MTPLVVDKDFELKIILKKVVEKNLYFKFKELKKELRDIVKLSKDNLDIKSWATELKLWIKIQVQRVIEDLGEDSDDESDDSSDEEEDDDEEKILENFYGIKEDQNLLLKELRA
ncbi:hypothetical protein H8356DRAFT_1369590, partial [Neocallimastix lanati (nom. inval.)]